MKRPEVRLSAAVMAHPRRAGAAGELARRIVELDPVVVTDPAPTGATLTTARLAWAAVGDSATHHLVLQDDVLLGLEFTTRIREAIGDRPDAVLAFFVDWGTRSANVARIAAMRGDRWIEVCDGFVPAQALVLPAALARTFGDHKADDDVPDDVALYEHTRDHDRYVHVVNLADHDDVPSEVGNQFMGARRSVCYHQDPQELEFGTGTTTGLIGVPIFSWVNGKGNVHFRRDPDSGDWFKVHALTALRLHGMSDSMLESPFRSALTGLGTTARRAMEPWAWELWLTAVALGTVAGGGRAATTGTATAATALSTLTPGGLRNFLTGDDLSAIHRAAGEFAAAGAEAGIASVRGESVASFGEVELPEEYFTERRWP